MLQESAKQFGDPKVLKHNLVDENTILHEYEATITILKEELCNCKLEQNKLHAEIEILQKENKIANDRIQRCLAEYNPENCENVDNHEVVMNLEKRITILQMEKDSVFQLWQMSLKAIDVLENDIKAVNNKDDTTFSKNSQFYQEQINNIKETYSEAIIALESKLVATKDNFFKQQTVCQKSKVKIEQLTKEKNELIQQLGVLRQQSVLKESKTKENIHTLKENLKDVKKELKDIKQLKVNLEERLKNTEKYVTVMASKDQEAKSKVLEAVELVESAVREKETALQREAKIVEDKIKLETCLSKLSEEYTARLETEMQKAKETYSKNIRKHILEIKELKAELREQGTLLDRSQRDYRLIEEELEKVRQSSDNSYWRTNTKISNLEQTLQRKDSMLKINEDNCKAIYDDRIQYLEEKITNLQEKLSDTSEKLRCSQLRNYNNSKGQMREASDCTKEVMEKCTNFEKQLSVALADKEDINKNLHLLQISFEKEIQQRNCEKKLLESQVQSLQEKITSAEKSINFTRTFPSDSTTLDKRNTEQKALVDVDSVANILSMQKKYDKKTRTLTQLVATHQKLSNKWKEEANLITSKFEKRTEDYKNKISVLQKQNDDLTRELIVYQQLLARCNSQFVQTVNYERAMDDR